MTRGTQRFLPLFVTFICLVLILPIVIVIVLAFSGQEFLKFPPDTLSLRWFGVFFGDSRWRAALWSSVAIAVIACVVATIVGFLASYALVRGSMGGKKIILSIMLLPMIVPTVITAIAMYFLSARLGLVGNVLWVGCCHAVIALPVVLLILLSTLQGVDVNLERAALSLGGSRARVMLRVVAPIAMPGIVSAALFAFLASFDELIISLFLTNVATQTLPVRIWNSLHLEIEPVIAAVSAFLIGITAAILLLDGVLRRRRSARL
ncbi:MAG TPA: ABC transporter permease [Alphaproteobacteria bacterium]|nr:ABC transporter permease [Alphaproteobacteria bacterium]